jgi:hypothetical protein
MKFAIDPQVVRAFWPAFLPLASVICLLILASVFCRYKRRQLLTTLSWVLFIFVAWTAYFVWIMVDLSTGAL